MSQTIVSSLTPLFAHWWSVVGAIAAGMAFVAHMADRDARICILFQAFPGFAIQILMTLIPFLSVTNLRQINPALFIISFVIGIFCGVNFFNFVVFIIYIRNNRSIYQWDLNNKIVFVVAIISYPITQLLFNFVPKNDM